MSGPAILIVDPNDARRATLATAFANLGVPTYDVPQAFDAMNTLGRADFAAVVVQEGRRRLSVRGLLQLALRSHEEIVLVVQSDGEPQEVADALGVPIILAPVDADPHVLANDVALEIDRQTKGPDLERAPTERFERPVMAPEPITLPPVPGAETFEEPEETVRTEVFSDTQSSEAPAGSPSEFEHSIPNEVKMPAPMVRAQLSGEILRSPPPEISGSILRATSTEKQIDLAALRELALIEGDLFGHAGCPLLTTLMARGLTGRLDVRRGEAAGEIFFFCGEPVAARADDEGQALRWVCDRFGVEHRSHAVVDGDLYAALVDDDVIAGDVAHDLYLGFLRDRVLALANQDEGEYTFFEEDTFLRSRPLVRVNPFGLILEARRRRTSPAQLMALSASLQGRMILPMPSLSLAAPKLKPFTGHVDIAELLGPGVAFEDWVEVTGLDPMMGAWVLLALVDARCVELGMLVDEEATQRVSLAPSVDRVASPHTAFAGGTEEILEPLDQRRPRLEKLWFELSNATHPRTVLGSMPDDDAIGLEQAFDDRSRVIGALFLDETEDPALKALALKLRYRLDRAYAVLREGLGT